MRIMIISLTLVFYDKMQVGEMLHEAVSYEDLNFGDSSRPLNDFQTDSRNEMENNLNQTNVPNGMEKNVS